METNTEYVGFKKSINNLEEAKDAVEELQKLTEEVFQKATDEGYREDLAMYVMSLQANKQGR